MVGVYLPISPFAQPTSPWIPMKKRTKMSPNQRKGGPRQEKQYTVRSMKSFGVNFLLTVMLELHHIRPRYRGTPQAIS